MIILEVTICAFLNNFGNIASVYIILFIDNGSSYSSIDNQIMVKSVSWRHSDMYQSSRHFKKAIQESRLQWRSDAVPGKYIIL